MASKALLVACLMVLWCFKIEATRTLDTSIKPQGDPAETNHCYAIVRTNDPSSTYLGAGGSVSIFNPSTVSPEWSAARMRLQNGDDSIEAGWMVNQDIFKDKKPHLYIRFRAGGKGCFNLKCPGFVQVAKDVVIGLIPDKISERGKEQFGWRLSINKHKDDGNWWLSIDNDKYDIGYWPKTLFTSLADHANQVEWGGEVNYPSSSGQLPPEMGCGYKPDYDTKYAASYHLTKVVDGMYTEIDPPRSTVKYANCDKYYTVQDMGYMGSEGGRIMLFGGPGNAHPSIMT